MLAISLLAWLGHWHSLVALLFRHCGFLRSSVQQQLPLPLLLDLQAQPVALSLVGYGFIFSKICCLYRARQSSGAICIAKCYSWQCLKPAIIQCCRVCYIVTSGYSA